MDPLKKFLIKFKRNGSDNITHTIIPDKINTLSELKFGYSLTVKDEDMGEFNTYIHDLFFNEKRTFSLTESFSENTPLILDLDMLYENVEKNRYYTKETLLELTKIITSQIHNYIDINDDSSLECWITEKKSPSYTENSDNTFNVKDGLHIIFPYLIGQTKIFKEFIKTFSNDDIAIKIKDIFECTSLNNIAPNNDVNKIFDSNVQRWFTYGCGKTGKEPYLLTKIIDCKKFDFIEKKYTTKEIMEKTSVVCKRDENITYKNGIDNTFKNNMTSSNSVSTFDMINSDSEEEVDYDPYLDNHNDDNDTMTTNLMNAEIQNIKKLVTRCLSVDRANEYDLWIKLGMCLKNIGGEQFFSLWDEYSQRGNNYEGEEECEKFWNGFKRDGLGRGTLNYWSKMDNMDEYMKIREENLISKIDNCVLRGGQHDDVAEVVSGYFKDQFICADLKEGWYHFDGNKWVPCPKGYLLHKSLSGEIKEIFYRRHQFYKKEMDRLAGEGNEIASQNYDGYQKSAYKIYDNLKNVTHNENIMKACKLKFYKEKIMETMDSNTKLLGFDNCVFDLEENIIREGRPEDYISMTTKLNLPINPNELPMTPDDLWNRIPERVGKYKLDSKNEKIWNKDKWDNGNSKFFNMVYNDIRQFFKEILPDPQIRKYCLRFIASRMCGDVLEQRFSIWTGSGGNGKSILIDIIRYTFGEYCINLPVTLLTQKRKASNAACPEKARTRGVRLCYMQEPDSGERINAGEMKELSGGDMIQARKLYSDIFEFKPQFEIVLMCNEKPTIDDKTNGAWRRVQVYPFVSRFVDDKKQINPEKNVYKRDKALPTKLEHWSIIFMCMLMREWVSMGGGIDEDTIPDSIRMETENYKNQNDIVGQWISEDLQVNENETMPFNELFNAFENWFTENHNNGKVDKITIKRRLIDWQKKSTYGFADGSNGSERHPKFNLEPKPEN